MTFETQPLFTKEVKDAFQAAFDFAIKNKYEYVTVDTIMWALSQTKRTKEIFEGISINQEEFQNALEEHLKETIEVVSVYPDNQNGMPLSTIAVRNWLMEANLLQRTNGADVVDEEVLLITLFNNVIEDTYSIYFLDQKDVNRQHVYNFLKNGQTREIEDEQSTQEERGSNANNAKNPLKKYAVLLNARAEEGKIDPVIGREKEIENVVTVLAQRRKNNPLLVGDAGVGKTAIAEGLALRIVQKSVPVQLQQMKVYSVDMGALLAGTKYRGDFEDRLDKLIKEASRDPNVILFIDEIHNIIGAGSSGGAMDASNMLKPALSNGSLKVLGATTFDEYKKLFEKESALARRFQKIDVDEPSPQEAIQILHGLKPQYEKFHGLTYTDEAIKSAVNLTVKYQTDRKLPDKAIDMIDMAGAKIKLANNGKTIIDENDISELLAKIARIPVSDMVATEKLKLKELDANLRKTIYGQDEAIEKVVDAVLLSRANLVGKEKPIASFLMAGPTGVGKTELARQVAKNLEIPLVRFDMSEYMDKVSLSRLIGAAPGYVGYEEGGQLVDAIRKTPHCLLLLDEIEKADPSIFNILLQVMDYAQLTDNKGKKADFKNVIIMLTSNAGAMEINRQNMGFSSGDSASVEEHAKKERDDVIRRAFRPEFYNRLDAVIQFNPLSKKDIVQVVHKQLRNLENLLIAKEVKPEFSATLAEYIAEKAHDPKLGARPIERFVETQIAKPLSREIIFGQLENGGAVLIDVEDDKIVFKFNQEAKSNIILETVMDETKAVEKKIVTKKVVKEKLIK